MVKFENEVCEYLRIPSIPKKAWDGKSSFENGVAVIELVLGETVYAIAKFNAETDIVPRIVKVFSYDAFMGIKDVFVVPDYMDTDVQEADLDEESKKHAETLAKEAEEIENEGVEQADDMPKHEWIFEEIHSREEAEAYIRSYNQRNHIKRGKVPKTEEGIKLRLYAIYSELQKKAQ